MRKWDHGQQAEARQLLATTWQDVRLLSAPRTPIRSREYGTELECEPPRYQDLVLFMGYQFRVKEGDGKEPCWDELRAGCLTPK